MAGELVLGGCLFGPWGCLAGGGAEVLEDLALAALGTAGVAAFVNTFSKSDPISQAPPISTPADPNGRNSHPKDPCKWPDNPEDMDKMLDMEGDRIPDRPGPPSKGGTPGRDKVVWDLVNTVITYEGHPYHPNAPDFHRLPHWHLDTPGNPHQRFRPGDKIPNCK